MYGIVAVVTGPELTSVRRLTKSMLWVFLLSKTVFR